MNKSFEAAMEFEKNRLEKTRSEFNDETFPINAHFKRAYNRFQ